MGGIQQHSPSERFPTIAGWLNLDDLVRKERVGIELIKRELGDEPATITVRSALLDLPLNAWLHIDLERNPPGNEASPRRTFEDEYWHLAARTFTFDQSGERSFQTVQAALIQLFRNHGGRSVSLGELKEVADLSGDDLFGAIDALMSAQLVRTSPTTDGIEMADPGLWAAPLARSIKASLPPSVEASVDQLTQDLEAFHPDFAEAIVMHVIGVLSWDSDAERDGFDLDARNEFVRRLIRADSVGNAGIWAAGLAFGTSVQELVVGALETELAESADASGASPSQHELFLLLRLCDSATSFGSFAERMSAVQRSYHLIGESGLYPLLQSMLRWLRGSDVESQLQRWNLLQRAHGIERALSARQFAQAWTDRTVSTVGARDALTDVTGWFEFFDLGMTEDTDIDMHEGARKPEAPLALHLADAVAGAVVDAYPPKVAYARLLQAHWLDPSAWPSPLGVALRSTCHVFLGHRHSVDPGGVSDLIESLLWGKPSKQNPSRDESALFILRHTGSTLGRSEVRIAPALHPYLVQLAQRAKLRPHIRDRYLVPMLRANGLMT